MLYLLYSLLEVLMCVKVLKALRSPAVFTTVFYKVIFVISMTILWNSCYMEHILRNPGLEDKSQKLLKAENEALHSYLQATFPNSFSFLLSPHYGLFFILRTCNIHTFLSLESPPYLLLCLANSYLSFKTQLNHRFYSPSPLSC